MDFFIVDPFGSNRLQVLMVQLAAPELLVLRRLNTLRSKTYKLLRQMFKH